VFGGCSLAGHLLCRLDSQQVILEYLRFGVGSCVDSMSIGYCSVEIVCLSRSGIMTVRGIVCRSQNSVWVARGISFGGVDRFGNSPRVSL